MNKKSNKILEQSKLINELISDFNHAPKEEEFGIVKSNIDGILHVYGLDYCYYNELLLVDNKYHGIAFSLQQDYIGVIMLNSDFHKITENMKVTRTKELFSVPVGDELLGRVINALCEPLDHSLPFKNTTLSPVEKKSQGVMFRDTVNQPLMTGKLVVDSMFPIGKGQRELIIGDRQTGKTTLAIDTILLQKGKNCYCVYVAIGQKISSIIQTIKTLKEHDAMSYTTIVVASASDLPAQKYLSPFTGITIAEHWMNQGKDVLIIYDDLSQHSVSYRTLSLLLGIPSGREAFPGDIFYLHSRLLERSGKLCKELGNGSITALPIIETQAGDISSYIPTNVISITDGQIFLKTSLFNSNLRPAVDVGLSVSRVGSAAQTNIIKKLCGSLKLTLSQYYEVIAFSQFSSDLDPNTKQILQNGEKIIELLKQETHQLYSENTQAFFLYIIKENLIKQIKINQMQDFKSFTLDHPKFSNYQSIELKDYDSNTKSILSTLSNEIIKDFIQTSISLND